MMIDYVARLPVGIGDELWWASDLSHEVYPVTMVEIQAIWRDKGPDPEITIVVARHAPSQVTIHGSLKDLNHSLFYTERDAYGALEKMVKDTPTIPEPKHCCSNCRYLQATHPWNKQVPQYFCEMRRGPILDPDNFRCKCYLHHERGDFSV